MRPPTVWVILDPAGREPGQRDQPVIASVLHLTTDERAARDLFAVEQARTPAAYMMEYQHVDPLPFHDMGGEDPDQIAVVEINLNLKALREATSKKFFAAKHQGGAGTRA
jgi:hypothetical protein